MDEQSLTGPIWIQSGKIYLQCLIANCVNTPLTATSEQFQQIIKLFYTKIDEKIAKEGKENYASIMMTKYQDMSQRVKKCFEDYIDKSVDENDIVIFSRPFVLETDEIESLSAMQFSCAEEIGEFEKFFLKGE